MLEKSEERMLTRVAIKGVKSPLAENPRFPAQRSSAQGESAPKVRQRCVADGKRVKIPVLSFTAMWGRRWLGEPGVGCPGLCVYAFLLGKSGVLMSRHDDCLSMRAKSLIPSFQEKPLSFR